jgi:hypothetical protein
MQLQRPAILPVGMLFVPRRFHDAVECHELGCDQPCDRESLLLRAGFGLACLITAAR